MEALSSLIHGFGVLADPMNILYMFIGIFLGWRESIVVLVAVPAVWLFNYFTGKVDGFVVEMDNSASELVDYFIKNRTKQLKP